MKTGITGILRNIALFFIPYLIVLCVCLLIKLNYSRETIFFTVNGIHNAVFDKAAIFFTALGDGWTTIGLSVILLLFSYRKAFLLITSYATSSIVAQILKHIFDAPRPKAYFTDKVTDIYFVKGVDIYTAHSFPSGHTVTAFSGAVLFAYLFKNKKWGPLLLIIAMLIGYSRMYLTEHFFEDVMAGSVIGVFVTLIWLYFIENKPFIHSEKWKKGLIK
jgi:membrane-associated phospholipid phosphatase